MLIRKAVEHMEWIRISDSKLKIMLSAEDARRYALDCKTADYADVMTRNAFREILTEVRAETGFDATEDKVYIQMYPSKEGGCELFITKMGLVLADHGFTESVRPCPASKNTAKYPKSPQTVRKRECVFTFSKLEDLLSLCKRMTPFFKGESQVWQDEQAVWWLLLSDHGDLLTVREDFRFALEYGIAQQPREARLYLGEHGKVICPQNAVATLGAL